MSEAPAGETHCNAARPAWPRWLPALGLLFSIALARAAEPAPGAAILQDLKSFDTVATVLHVGAHPDDENTQLITYLARGRGYRAAYLSLTRGDGGQNEIGGEFDEKLGVARTQELLAARRLDGGRQFFTRAIDFGFSKTPEETLTFWNRDEVLGDVVRVIRTFRPDVIVTRFPIPPGSGGHGHHTASGILAVEAFKLVGDPNAYPEQLKQGLAVWQPKRVVWNGFGGGRGGGQPVGGSSITVDIGGNDPVTGESFGSIAGRSRSQHVTQGLGGFGGGGRGGPSPQTFVHFGGEEAKVDLMDGVDTTWARVKGGDEIAKLAGDAIAAFKGDDPAASVPALLVIRKKLAALGARPTEAHPTFVAYGPKGPPGPQPNNLDAVLTDKIDQLDRIIVACLGLEVRTTAERAEVVPGEKFKVRMQASVRSNALPVTWQSFSTPTIIADEKGRRLEPGKPTVEEWTEDVPKNEPMTHPYWLREDPVAGLARVSDPTLIGRPENPPQFAIGYDFKIGDETIEVVDTVIGAATADTNRPRPVAVIPPVSLRFVADVSVFKPGTDKDVVIEAVAARAKTNGTLSLSVPNGWKVSPASLPLKIEGVGEKQAFTFHVTAPAQPTTGRMSATVEVGGQRYSNQRFEINYPHIPLQLLQAPAKARLVSVEFEAKGKNVGYLPGAGDDTAEALEQLGYQVTTLSGADLTPEKLKNLDAVVIGVRAFNERKDLAANLPGLFAYVENGGTVVAQYNRPNGLTAPQLGPYQLSIQGPAPALRVTDETAAVSFVTAEHPALNVPNKITTADFAGWVQERGAYFPSGWDEKSWVPLFAMSDPGEAPLRSSVLVARHGKGYYVYTGLAFFRQLPAGVPGAYRLFANLVSLGK